MIDANEDLRRFLCNYNDSHLLTGVKFEVKRVWIDCLLDNKTKWKDRAAKGMKYYFTLFHFKSGSRHTPQNRSKISDKGHLPQMLL